jgi:hypothetical protein
MTFDAEKRVSQYVQLRDELKRMDDEHADRKRPLTALKEKLEAQMLEYIQATNSNSISTNAGTMYITPRKSASLADPAAFMEYVIKNNAWDLLDRKANVTAVEDFINEHEAPPPGCNFSTRLTIGVQRKS